MVTIFTMIRDFMYRIMKIEDDLKIRWIVADTLKKWQYDVVEVTQFD
jgi:DNA-binding response OmpR family regulator